MLYLAIKAILSGIIIAIVSEVAKRFPGFGALIASLPMFLIIPAMLRSGVSFWLSLVAGCTLTIALYLAMVWAGPRFGLRL